MNTASLRTERLSYTEHLVRSFVRNAYMMYSADDIAKHRERAIDSGDLIKARFMSEMIAECRAENVSRFCDLPAFSTTN